MVKKFLYVNRRAPYGSSYAMEAIDVVLIGAAFDQDISVLFIDDGVFQLKEGQDTLDVDMKNISPALRALDMYDVDKIYVATDAMATRGLKQRDLVIEVEMLSDAKIQDLMDAQDVIFSF
ncbi:tRNA 5-methylaminomethyl-2-thiouridine synthase subunit TusC [hydrothermal vent metagenome]|uniref:tRNA 5-methylaminomethyl-2-thiouridine synthase subunit TusC n=1 Tax=hydrothermal vent metagenome TaxID=652676 RepID=A0A3B1B6J5_9ZZZZ